MKRNAFMPVLLAILLLFWLAPGPERPYAREAMTRVAILHGKSGIASRFGRDLQALLEKKVPNLVTGSLTQPVRDEEIHGNDLLVLVGSEALRQYLASPSMQKIPALALLVTRQHFERIWHQLPAEARTRLTGIFIDPPPSRLFLLAVHAFPERRRIGILLSRTTRSTLPLLEKLATRTGRTLIRRDQEPDKRLVPNLERLFEESDVFLALPDPEIINRNTLQPILLTSYRYRLPVVAFSRAYVKAGATAAIYTPIDGLAEETVELVSSLLKNPSGKLPRPRYSSRFRVALNRQVARSLGIPLPQETRIEQAIRDWERKNR